MFCKFCYWLILDNETIAVLEVTIRSNIKFYFFIIAALEEKKAMVVIFMISMFFFVFGWKINKKKTPFFLINNQMLLNLLQKQDWVQRLKPLENAPTNVFSHRSAHPDTATSDWPHGVMTWRDPEGGKMQKVVMKNSEKEWGSWFEHRSESMSAIKH